jgi:ADP-heptose:LPS heptosyltransferase
MRQKVLVILPNNLGDVIMAAPVLEGLKRRDPEAHVTFFVEEGYDGGIVNNPFCDAIFRFKRGDIRDLSRSDDWTKALTNLNASVSALKSERFSKVINLSQHSYIPYIVSLLSCPDTVGREYVRAGNHAVRDTWSQYLYAVPFARRFNSLHAIDLYRRIAGTDGRIPPSVMTVTEAERVDAVEKITVHGWRPHNKPVMVLQPGAAFAAKQWPFEHFVALGKLLIDDGYSVMVTGAPQEREIAEGLQSQLGEACFTTAGICSFRETIALLPGTVGCVTGDTAIMHAAAALQRKVYALFGPTNPVETGPYGKGNFVVSGRCARRPCFCFDCKTRLCMKSILPADVYSCIKTGKTNHCDSYATAMAVDGTLLLEPVVESGPGYYSKTGAMITRKFVEPDFVSTSPVNGDDRASVLYETGVFIKALDDMTMDLSLFVKTHDKTAIGRFEERRATLASLSEIGAFWTALLNLRLNSVPMLDPIAAVGEYLAICTGTKSQVEHAVVG